MSAGAPRQVMWIGWATWLWALLAATLCMGCAGADDTAEAAGDVAPVQATDAGDEAFVRRVAPLMWGRRVHGVAELAVLERIAAVRGRGALVRAMSRSVEYRDRWEQWLKDTLSVHRIHAEASPGCYGRRLQGTDSSALAVFVRDHEPKTGELGSVWSGKDLIRSALILDDLSPVWRFHLLQDVFHDWFTPNAEEARASRSRRAELFLRTYVNRRWSCVACHNAVFATTDSPDPEKDRHWPLPYRLEKGIYGEDGGINVAHVRPFFRRRGVVAGMAYDRETKSPAAQHDEFIKGRAPFGADESCGRLYVGSDLLPNDIPDDPYFVEVPTEGASIWILEGHLHAGIDRLRAEGMVAGADLIVDGEAAFAYLVAMNAADQVWKEALGARLTLSNMFARNAAQRDTLWALTELFVDHDFSLVELLVAITADPDFNPARPADMAGSARVMMPRIDPFADEERRVADRRNSVGDTIRRLPARVLLKSVRSALGWAPLPEFLIDASSPDAKLLRGTGVFLKDADAGFSGINLASELSWEAAFGRCEPRTETSTCPLLPILAAGDGSATTRCAVCSYHAEACAWDDRCCAVAWADWCSPECMADRIPGVVELETFPQWPRRAPGEDYVGRLAKAAQAGDVSVGAALATLKDRLLSEPTIEDGEERAVLEAVAAVPLDRPAREVADLEARLRDVCGLWLATPQFQLLGNPGHDALGQAPPVVLAEDTPEATCVRLRDEMGLAALSCSAAGATVAAP